VSHDVVVLGSANVDLVAYAPRLPAPGETVLGTDFAEHAGGKGLNQAVAAARAGASVAFVGAVGDDEAGRWLTATMVHEGIDVSHVVARADLPTGRALIGVAGSGENSIIVVPGANATVTEPASPLPCRVLVAQLEVPPAAVARAFAAARGQGALTVLNPAPAPAAIDRGLLACTDDVVPNEHELVALGGPEVLLAGGATTVVATLGGRGVEVHDARGSLAVDAFAVDVVDTTAAGDAFCGALCARLAAGHEVRDAVRWAAAAGALATTRRGTLPSLPHAGEIDRVARTSR
jgi:ribokinase